MKMLPKDLPQLGYFLVNTVAQSYRIELQILVAQAGLHGQVHLIGAQHSLIGRSCFIIPFDRLFANLLFTNQLQDWLEEVDVQTQVIVDAVQELQLFLGLEAVIADQMTYHRPVLLLDMRLVVFLVGPGTGEGHPFVLTVTVRDFVDELAAIVRIQSQQGKRQALTHGLDGGKHEMLRAMQDGHTLRPAGGDIGGGERIEKLPFDALATMRHQIDFHESRAGIIPVGIGADRDGFLEQRARFGRGQTMPLYLKAGWPQAAVDRGGAHAQQLGFDFRRERQFLMAFQDSYDLGQEGFEPFRADTTTDLPNVGQDRHNFALVFLTPSFLAQAARLPTVLENSDGIFAVITGCGYKFVQDPCFAPF